jgi:hypothetical protein
MIKQPLTFTTDRPLEPGTIYQITNGTEKRVISTGSVSRAKLTGHWKIIREFKSEIINRDENNNQHE